MKSRRRIESSSAKTSARRSPSRLSYIGGSPWSEEVEDGLKDLFARFEAALDSVGVIAEILDKPYEAVSAAPARNFRRPRRHGAQRCRPWISPIAGACSPAASTSTIGPPSSAGSAIAGSITENPAYFRRALSTRPLALGKGNQGGTRAGGHHDLSRVPYAWLRRRAARHGPPRRRPPRAGHAQRGGRSAEPSRYQLQTLVRERRIAHVPVGSRVMIPRAPSASSSPTTRCRHAPSQLRPPSPLPRQARRLSTSSGPIAGAVGSAARARRIAPS